MKKKTKVAMNRRTPNRIHQGLWFPLALTVLLLLALPGAVLLALSLLGYENSANGLLQRNFNLSYHNPLPAWAAVLLFLVPLLVVLLYFLKLRRKPLQVPSTFLWRKSIEDLHVNSLFQWLRDNVLLLVQLCIVLLLIYSLLAFQVHGRLPTGGKHYILLIDSSASMSVTDVAPSRLDVAKKEALEEIDSHPEGDTGMVIEFNSRASILQPYTRDKGLLRAAVRRDRADAAADRASTRPSPWLTAWPTRIAPPTTRPSVLPARTPPRRAPTSLPTASPPRSTCSPTADSPTCPASPLATCRCNITASARRSRSGQQRRHRQPQRRARREGFFASASLCSIAQLQARIAPRSSSSWNGVRSVSDIFSRAEQPLTLPGRVIEAGDQEKDVPVKDRPERAALTFDLADVDESIDFVIHAKIKNQRDQFALDDEAWLVAGVVRKARILIVTPGNEMLRAFFDLEETTKVARVSYLKPAELKDQTKYGGPARSGEFDLVVFDRCAPPSEDALPLANTFFIDSVPPPWKRKDMPPLKNALIRNPTSNHPLMRNLTGLDEIAFSEAFRFDLRDPRVPPRTPRLLEADRETVLMFVLARRSFQDLVLAFPLVNDKGEWTTTWNLKASFPVFLRNVLYTLGNISDAAAEENVQPGQGRVLRPDGAIDRIEVTDPDRRQTAVKRGTGQEFIFQETDKVGVYQATWPGGGRAFAVNLLDAEESNTQPRDEIKLGRPAHRRRTGTTTNV